MGGGRWEDGVKWVGSCGPSESRSRRGREGVEVRQNKNDYRNLNSSTNSHTSHYGANPTWAIFFIFF